MYGKTNVLHNVMVIITFSSIDGSYLFKKGSHACVKTVTGLKFKYKYAQMTGTKQCFWQGAYR